MVTSAGLGQHLRLPSCTKSPTQHEMATRGRRREAVRYHAGTAPRRVVGRRRPNAAGDLATSRAAPPPEVAGLAAPDLPPGWLSEVYPEARQDDLSRHCVPARTLTPDQRASAAALEMPERDQAYGEGPGGPRRSLHRRRDAARWMRSPVADLHSSRACGMKFSRRVWTEVARPEGPLGRSRADRCPYGLG